MKIARAALAGAVAALVVVLLLLAVQWLFGVRADVAMPLGMLALPQGGLGAWIAGAVAQVIAGVVAGVIYGAVFELVFRHAGVLAGLAVALPHVVIAGLAVGFLPVWFGAGTDPLPGAFLAYGGGLAAACFVAAHLLFGAMVGVLYGRTLHRAAPPAPTWRDLPAPDASRSAP